MKLVGRLSRLEKRRRARGVAAHKYSGLVEALRSLRAARGAPPLEVDRYIGQPRPQSIAEALRRRYSHRGTR